MDTKPNLYVLVPYSVRSKLIKQVESTLDTFLHNKNIDIDLFNKVSSLFKNVLRIQEKYTSFIFQYYKLFNKLEYESIFAKSYQELKLLFKDLYVIRYEFMNLPIISKLSSDEYDQLVQYLLKNYTANDSIIHLHKLLELPFIRLDYKILILYETVLYLYFSIQTIPDTEGLFVYGFKLTQEKQKKLLNVLLLSEEKKKDIQKYFTIINKLFNKIKLLYIRDIKKHWNDREDPIYTILKSNFFKPISSAIALSYNTSIIDIESYLNNYKIDIEDPIIHKVQSDKDPANESIESFYNFLEIFNIISNETNYIVRKELYNFIIHDSYTNNFRLENQLSLMKEPMLLTNNQYHKLYLLDYYNRIHQSDAIGLCRFVWKEGKYKYVPLPILETKTVHNYLLNTCLFKDPVPNLYYPNKYVNQTASDLFTNIDYKLNIQLIHSLIFQHIIVPEIEEKINKL